MPPQGRPGERSRPMPAPSGRGTGALPAHAPTPRAHARVLPAHATLMELRTAGWTLADVADTYLVSAEEVRNALVAGHPRQPAT